MIPLGTDSIKLIQRVFHLEHLRHVREINIKAAYDSATLITVEMYADNEGHPEVDAEWVRERYEVTVRRIEE